MNTEDNNSMPRIAILSLTEGAARLAMRAAKELPNCTVYMPARLEAAVQKFSCDSASFIKEKGSEGEPQESPCHVVWFTNWQKTISEAFFVYDALLCIMATGIAVRSLAPLLQSKYRDPAVLVLDEQGHFVISLLSGHVGGANRLAREVAEKLGGQAVITTATDVAGKPALDMMAQQMNGVVEPAYMIKKFNRYLAEENEINLYSPWPLQASFKEGFKQQAWLPCLAGDFKVINQDLPLEPAVIISPYRLSFSQAVDVIQIRPRNLSVGIGCRRGVPLPELRLALEEVFRAFGLDINCINKLTSIDFKMSEQGMVDLASQLQVPLMGFSRNEIAAMDGYYEASQRVLERIGVGGVCEPTVLLATNHGLILVPKQKCGRVTISVAMEKSWWWDWDQVSGT